MNDVTPTPEPGKNLYKNSGVDIARADGLVGWLQEDSLPPGVVAGIGGFASLFRPDFSGIRDPLLVSATDGVGTKLLLALEEDNLEGLGQDLVAMCVNDLYTLGARPLFFLDYYGSGRLSEDTFTRVLTGMKKALQLCKTALIGGETAELPGLYERGHFDLAGFVVGVADGARLAGPEHVQKGDVLLALPSSGFHSNGFSLIRKWLKELPSERDSSFRARLLEPTKLYFEIPELWAATGPACIHAMAHITGGGIPGNLARVIPKGLHCRIESSALPTPAWMREFWESRGMALHDVSEAFNLGVGMVLVVNHSEVQGVQAGLRSSGLDPVEIGHVVSESPKKPQVSFL